MCIRPKYFCIKFLLQFLHSSQSQQIDIALSSKFTEDKLAIEKQ